MNETLTNENLLQIKAAMDRIAEIDKSLYFKNYYSEIINRLDVIDRRVKIKEERLNPPCPKKEGYSSEIPINPPTESFI